MDIIINGRAVAHSGVVLAKRGETIELFKGRRVRLEFLPQGETASATTGIEHDGTIFHREAEREERAYIIGFGANGVTVELYVESVFADWKRITFTVATN